MHHYANTVGGQVEQAASLNDFEALIHQGSGIDGDAASHFPGGMIQRLLDGDGGKLCLGGIQERSAGSSQPDALDFLHAAAAQALMDGVVLTIDRQKRFALATRLSCD